MSAVLHASAYPYSQNIDIGILDDVSVVAKKYNIQPMHKLENVTLL